LGKKLIIHITTKRGGGRQRKVSKKKGEKTAPGIKKEIRSSKETPCLHTIARSLIEKGRETDHSLKEKEKDQRRLRSRKKKEKKISCNPALRERRKGSRSS